eukprot:TRINITY_DN48783_c0_g1_i1.p1 TRINITY_DN48783_c0_g1~~TRINITY_DN48783_c0_g1_i1.p1  ORF type:complete len:282 (-),score=48.50 TRINITY_DN48783_c0_g1_i1:245-1090(-)
MAAAFCASKAPRALPCITAESALALPMRRRIWTEASHAAPWQSAVPGASETICHRRRSLRARPVSTAWMRAKRGATLAIAMRSCPRHHLQADVPWLLARRGAAMSAGMRRRPAHEVLGVEASASLDEIKAAFRRQALRCHPDVAASGGGSPAAAAAAGSAAAQEFRELQEAYDELLGRGTGDSEAEVGPRSSDGSSSGAGEEEGIRPQALFYLGALIFAVPCGMVLPDAIYGRGVLNSMMAERALLQAGGWACHSCTAVNESSASQCFHCKRAKPVVVASQ